MLCSASTHTQGVDLGLQPIMSISLTIQYMSMCSMSMLCMYTRHVAHVHARAHVKHMHMVMPHVMYMCKHVTLS